MYRNGTHPMRASIEPSRFRGYFAPIRRLDFAAMRRRPAKAGRYRIKRRRTGRIAYATPLEHPAAGYIDDLAGDVVGGVGGEEFYCCCYVLGAGGAAHGGSCIADAAGFVGG